MSREYNPDPAVVIAHSGVIRVLVADCTRLGTDLVVGMLQKDSRFDSFACESTLESFISGLRQAQPDIALVGVPNNSSGSHTIELIRVGRINKPGLNAIVLLESSNNSLVVEAFRAGARGVLSRDDSGEKMLQCLLSVYDGQVWARNSHLVQLVQAVEFSDVPRTIVDATGKSMLTKREMEIVHGVADGLTNREIGSRLQLSEHTIKNYLLRIFDKLGVSNRAELVSYVLHHRRLTDEGRQVIHDSAMVGRPVSSRNIQ
jgi:DNA-binding NarL/FixJ family response regulator